MIDEGAYILICGVIAITLWWLFTCEYRKYRIDLMRQDIFAIRYELFLWAAENKAFDTRAYGMTRTTLNGVIQFSHELSLRRILIIYLTRLFVKNDSGARYLKRLGQSIHELPTDWQLRIATSHAKMHYVILSHIAHTSLLLSPLFFLGLLVLKGLRKAEIVSHSMTTTTSNRKRWAIIDAKLNETASGMG